MSTCNCIVEISGCLVRQGGGEHAPAGGRVEEKGWTGSSSVFLVRGQGRGANRGEGFAGWPRKEECSSCLGLSSGSPGEAGEVASLAAIPGMGHKTVSDGSH